MVVRKVCGSPSTVVGVVPASKKALQLRQDELTTQMVAAQTANWYEAPRGARNGAAMAVQYGGRYGERATQKQSREEEAEG
jgi:hypothetical protein